MRLLMLALLLPATAACQSKWEKDGAAIAPSGAGATRTYAATGFTGVDLRGSDDVDVKTGTSFSVTAEGDPKVLDELEIQVVDGSLRVGRKEHHGSWFENDRGAKIHVVMPRLASANVGGSGSLTIDHAEGDVSAAIAGSGNLSIADLRGGAATLSVVGSGDMTLKGQAAKLTASIAGSGDVDTTGLTATGGDISITGSGSLKGTIKGDVSVNIIGSGDVELTGGAKCQVNAIGSGTARCS